MSLLTGLLFCLAVELYARSNTTFVKLAQPQTLLQRFEVGGDLLTIYDPEKGRRLRPHADVIVRNHYLSKRDVRITTNSLGFRDSEIDPERAENEVRILAIGDSVTVSDYLPVQDSFVEQLQENLSDEMPNHRVEVINAGVSDIGLSEEMGILREKGLSLQPDFVLLGFYLNDSLPPWGFAGRFAEPGIVRRYSVAANSVYRAVKLREWIQGDYEKRFRWIKEKEQLNWRESHEDFEKLVELAEYDWGAAWKDESWFEIRKQFKELRELSLSHNFKVIVVALPVVFQVDAKFIDNRPQHTLADLSKKMGFYFFDPLTELRTQEVDRLYYDQCHYTAFGNELLGKMLERFFMNNVLDD
ncbi:MAG: hypothetical protein KDD66_04040 [Bdellovibrionales bacterium]|nr:hypothetical protein [Bdellovibrionales bacterium]